MIWETEDDIWSKRRKLKIERDGNDSLTPWLFEKQKILGAKEEVEDRKRWKRPFSSLIIWKKNKRYRELKEEAEDQKRWKRQFINQT